MPTEQLELVQNVTSGTTRDGWTAGTTHMDLLENVPGRGRTCLEVVGRWR